MNWDITLRDAEAIAGIIGSLFGIINVINLLNTRAARRNSTLARVVVEDLRRVVGHPDPERVEDVGDFNLVQMIETVSDDLTAFRSQYKQDMDNVRARQIADEVAEFPRRPGRHA